LTGEQIEIYRAFLSAYPNTECPECSGAHKYVVDRTYPSVPTHLGDRCLPGLKLVANPENAKSYSVPGQLVKGLKNASIISDARYQDFGNTRSNPKKLKPILFKFTGMAFDERHSLAVFHYFGTRAGVGVVERDGEAWKLNIAQTINCRETAGP